MAIQWFPGHMHKARKEIAQVLPETDVILEVLDARIPYSSENPMLAEIRGDKPCLKVLTKADLADPVLTETWLAALTGSDVQAIATSTGNPLSIQSLPGMLKQLARADKPRIKPFVAMIVGIPNVGKSTLLNVLAGKTVAKTGNEPAITKRQQPIKLSEHWVVRDTPGVLWPNVENRASGFRLAATGAIRDTAMDSSEVAAFLLDYLCVTYPEQLKRRFGNSLPLHDSIGTLEEIGRQRGCLSSGALVDFDRAARLLLQELRSGQLGQITLETPVMREAELKLVEQARIASDIKREERRIRRQETRRKSAANRRRK